LSEVVRVMGDKLGCCKRGIKPNSKDMVLVNALIDLTFPNPTTTQLVSITAFVQKHVAWDEPEAENFIFGCLDKLDVVEIQVPPLDVRNAKLRNGQYPGSRLPLLTFG
jgi:hypothetical protein